MTDRTVRELPNVNMVGINQLRSERRLLFLRNISHCEDLVARADELLWVTMAAQTPFHLEGACLAHQWHLINTSMTALASDSFRDMDAVVEVREVGKIVNPCPAQRLTTLKTCADRFEDGGVCPDLRVTAHTGFRRGNPSRCRNFDAGMAIATVDAEATDMVFMAELHRLIAGNILLCDVGGAVDLIDQEEQHQQEDQSTKYARSRNSIRATMKYLGHRRCLRVGFVDPGPNRTSATIGRLRNNLPEGYRVERDDRAEAEGAGSLTEGYRLIHGPNVHTFIK